MKSNFQIIVLISLLISACQQKELPKAYQGKAKRTALTVVSKYPGRIDSTYIEEGQFVKKGDTLLRLSVPEVEAKRRQAMGAVEAAKAQYQMALNGASNEQLAQISAKLEAVTEQYHFAEKSFKRIENMHKDSLVSDQKYDEVYMKYQGAKAQYNGVKAKYDEVKKGVRNEKIRMALGTYERAQGALQEANVAYRERFLIAPQNMSIETIALNNGELALPGYGLITGYQLNSISFRFTVPESEINLYKVGEKHTVTAPFSNQTFDAKIVSIKQLTQYANITSAFPDYELSESTYEVKFIPTSQEKANKLHANITVLLEK